MTKVELIKWLESYQDREKKINDNIIRFVLPKGIQENDINQKGSIVYALKNNKELNVSVVKGDWEYTTQRKVENKSLVIYSGKKAYLRNRYIVEVRF